jgi:hypothetical protein
VLEVCYERISAYVPISWIGARTLSGLLISAIRPCTSGSL